MCGYVEIFDDILVEEDEVTATFEHSEPGISLIRNTASTSVIDNNCKGIDIEPHHQFYLYFIMNGNIISLVPRLSSTYACNYSE